MYTILRKHAPAARTVFGFLAVTLLVSTAAFAQSDILAAAEGSGSYSVGYFIGANSTAGGFPEAQIHIVNPGKTGGFGITGLKLGGGDLCANIYVFTPDQQLSECCSCKISPDGMAGITLTQLTNNPLNFNNPAQSGAIKIVASFGAGTGGGLTPPGGAAAVTGNPCDDGNGTVAAFTDYVPVGRLDSWITHVRSLGGTFGPAFSVTEIQFEGVQLSRSELNKLQQECFSNIAPPTLGGSGSGRGKCSCGISM